MKGESLEKRVLDVLMTADPKRGMETEEVRVIVKDDRMSVYAALTRLMNRGIAQRRSSTTDGAGRKSVRWRLKPVTIAAPPTDMATTS